ncbi:MAG: diaminopimelate decarboxylase [candidate division Zixibacteria bacterium RBG_16_53_22]|nr:MAG: diaminopimelate decarboxylase [candidate division Zixibacteria bacterium RBG_16_53_22]
MDFFHYKNGELHCEDVPVRKIAEKYSTPTFIYSLKTLARHFKVTSRAFGDIPHIICYAAKANPNLAILRVAALCGAGCDVVSEGELRSALKAGINKNKIVFSGVGKTDDEIAAAVKAGILFICAESMPELETIASTAGRLGKVARVAVRVNPDIDPGTHPYIATGLKETKFGMDERSALQAYRFCSRSRWLAPVGISMHIGSQVETTRPYFEAAAMIVSLFKHLWKQNIRLKYIDIGGGWAAHFRHDNKLPSPEDYVSAVKDLFTGLPVTAIAEPGRSVVGNAGIFVMRVIVVKRNPVKNFCIVDGGMNDFLRPALYGARHAVEPVAPRKGRKGVYDVVGPVCENSDFFAFGVKMPIIRSGDLIALFTAGAYGATMSSNYNSRPRAAEVAVAGKKIILVRRREKLADLVAGQDMTGIDDKLVRGLQ